MPLLVDTCGASRYFQSATLYRVYRNYLSAGPPPPHLKTSLSSSRTLSGSIGPRSHPERLGLDDGETENSIPQNCSRIQFNPGFSAAARGKNP